MGESRLKTPSQLPQWKAQVEGALAAKRLHAFAKVGNPEGTEEERQAYEEQQVAAMNSIQRMYKRTQTQMQNVTEAEIRMEKQALDAQATELILAGLSSDQLDDAFEGKTAAEKYELVQLYFGKQNQRRQLNVQAKMDQVKYRPAPNGEGMRKLVRDFTEIKRELQAAGGSIPEMNLMQNSYSSACNA